MFIFILEAAHLREGWHEPLETWFQLGSAHLGWPLLRVPVAGVSHGSPGRSVTFPLGWV